MDKEKQWLMIGADYNPRIWAANADSREDM